MATRTATRPRAAKPAPRSFSITIGGPRKTAARRRPKSSLLGDLGTVSHGLWVVGKWSGKHTLRFARWSAKQGYTHGKPMALRAARTVGGPVHQWAEDRSRFGMLTPVAAVTREVDGEVVTDRMPLRKIQYRTAVDFGLITEPPVRASGDRVMDDEPPTGRVWAAAERLDRETVAGGGVIPCPRSCGWSGPPTEYRTHFPTCTARVGTTEPVPTPAGTVATQEDTMIEPPAHADARGVLGSPAIQDTTELAAFLERVAADTCEPLRDGLATLANTYLRGAEVDDGISEDVRQASGHIQAAIEALTNGANRSRELYPAKSPNFAKVN